MLSQLSRGYGSWVAGYVDPSYGEKRGHHEREGTLLPEIDQESHCHGVTVGTRSGCSTAMSYTTTRHTKDTSATDIHSLPKTYTTRKGALQLYVAPEPEDDEEGDQNDAYQQKYAQIKRPAGQELIDLSLKLGTMGRLACSVLNFGDQDYDKEHASVSELKNKAFLKFLRRIDDPTLQEDYSAETLRPGEDMNTYLRELRSSSSMRNYGSSGTYIPKNREFLELQALLRGLDNNSWPMSYQQDGLSDRQSSGQFTRPASRGSSLVETPGPPSTPKSSYKVLSSKQLTASLKSASYLGRPASQFSVHDDVDDDVQSGISQPSATSAGFSRRPWTQESETHELLIDKFFKGSNEDWETDGNKHRKTKERSVLTGTEHLYQGRNNAKGEGHVLKFKGEGLTQGESHSIKETNEESQEDDENKSNNEEIDEESDVNAHWNEQVTRVNQRVDTPIDQSENGAIQPENENDVIHKSRYFDNSRSSLCSNQNPPVVTLQSFNVTKPNTPPDRNVLLHKRRKSLSAAIAFDPERLKNAIKGPRRRPQSSHAERTHPFMMKEETTMRKKNDSNYINYIPTTANWSTTGIEEPMVECEEFDATNTNKSYNDESESVKNDLNEIDNDNYQGNLDVNAIYTAYDDGDVEEDVLLRDIKECNEEVEQIEANMKSETGADTDSDSGTYVDEEILRELIEAEENGEGLPVNHKVENVDDEDDEANEMSEEIAKSDVVGEKDGEETNTGAENEMDNYNENEVDEVNDEQLSDLQSKSSRKVHSKMSAKLSAGDLQSEGTEAGLSDFHQDTAEPEVVQASPADQTNVGDSTGTHVDRLATHSQESDSNTLGLSQEMSAGEIENKQNEIGNIIDEPIDSKRTEDTEPNDVSNTVHDSIEALSNNEQIEPTGNREPHGDPLDDAGDLQIKVTIQVPQEDSNPENEVEDVGSQKQEESNIDSNTDNISDDNISDNNVKSDDAVLTVDTTDCADSETNNAEQMQYNEDTKAKTGVIPEKNKSEIQETRREPNEEIMVQSGQKAKPSIPGKPQATVTAKPKPNERKTLNRKEKKDVKSQQPKFGSKISAPNKIEGMVGKKVVTDSDTAETSKGILEKTITDEDLIQRPDEGTTASSIADELDALGLNKNSGKMEYPLLPKGKRPKAPREPTKLPDHLKEAMDRQTMKSYENLEKDLERMTAIVDESLSSTTLEAVGEGLTEEELEMAKQILQKKIEETKSQLDGKDNRAKGQKKKVIAPKGGAKKGKKKNNEEEKSEEELQRDAIKEKQAMEKKRRDEEAKELQRKIAERRLLLQSQDDAASAKAKELREQMEKLEQEADDLQRAEDEARDILSEVRKKQREERDARRKADAERRKQEASDRREKEKKEQEEKRRKEMEMMEKIADAEMRRRLREDEERKAYEEERLAQERYEEELREAQRQEEEEEEKMRELERQAEEEAMQRLIDEREAAERQRRRLKEEEENMLEIENQKREIMMQEEARLAEEKRKIEEEEQKRRQRDMDRLMELRRAEEEARQKLNEELEKRRSEALGRRDFNLENKQHVDKLRHYQGITRAWTFSYFVKWPRETYERGTRRSLFKDRRPIGDPDPRKVVKIKNPAPKKVDAAPANTDNPTDQPPQ